LTSYFGTSWILQSRRNFKRDAYAFGLINRCTAILASLFISVQIGSYTMLCWLTDRAGSKGRGTRGNFYWRAPMT